MHTPDPTLRPEVMPEDFDRALRPVTLADYTGQPEVHKQMEIFIDKDNRKVVIEKIPEEEVNIIPDLKFYDIKASTFTSFGKDDMHKVQADAKKRIVIQVEKSRLKEQARQRLMENLNSLVMMSRAIGWKVEDKTNTLSVGNIKMLDS